jgi:hypothetical protein
VRRPGRVMDDEDPVLAPLIWELAEALRLREGLPESGAFLCGYCRQWSNGPQQWIDHCQHKSHRRRVQQQGGQLGAERPELVQKLRPRPEAGVPECVGVQIASVKVCSCWPVLYMLVLLPPSSGPSLPAS